MEMITIVSRKRFHFHNPDPATDLLTHGVGTPNAPKYNDAVFTTNGTMEMQKAPAWINRSLGPDVTKNGVDLNERNLITWKHAVKDGDLYQVNVVNPQVAGADLEVSAEAQKAEQARVEKELEEAKTRRVERSREIANQLASYNKPQIIEYAAKEMNLTLDLKSTRDELLAAVEEEILKAA